MKKLSVLILAILIASFFFNTTAEAKVLLPDASGYHSDWTGTYADIDDYPNNDGDASYNTASVPSAFQTYNLENYSLSGTINGVRVISYVKVVGTAEEIRPVLRVAGADYEGTACSGLDSSGYKYCSAYWSVNPSTSSSWSTSDLTNLEVGIKTVQVGGSWEDAEYRVSQIYADVDFQVVTKKTKYHLFQRATPLNGTDDRSFTFSIGDPLDDIKSAFIEIKGVADPSSVNLDVAVDNSASTPVSYDATYIINSTGRPTSFSVNHDVTNYFKTFAREAGEYTRYIHLKTNNIVNLVNAKLTITYTKIIPPTQTGTYVVSGLVYSSIFDTGTSGAAYNSILWKGSLGTGNTGKVRFQMATSNSSSGPWNYIGGAGCDGSGWFEPASPYANTPAEIKCYPQLNNKRYYRYKVQICSNDCDTGGDYTPTVTDVVVSWSP
ncbi:MAG: hypothetical protein Q8Q21_00520 [bacterium]|nr:hypothetical protein [bacterium]